MTTKTEPIGRLLGLDEVAGRLALSLHTVRRWATMRRIPTVKLGGRVLVPERELDKFVEARLRAARSDLAA